MKTSDPIPKLGGREFLVLTSEEKRTICFEVLAFLLGLTTKHHRDTHTRVMPNTNVKTHAPASPVVGAPMARPHK